MSIESVARTVCVAGTVISRWCEPSSQASKRSEHCTGIVRPRRRRYCSEMQKRISLRFGDSSYKEKQIEPIKKDTMLVNKQNSINRIANESIRTA